MLKCNGCVEVFLSQRGCLSTTEQNMCVDAVYCNGILIHTVYDFFIFWSGMET